MREFATLEIEQSGAVVTVKLVSQAKSSGPGANLHWDLGEAMSELRGDNGVRVVVLTGEAEDKFLVPRGKDAYSDAKIKQSYTDPRETWETFTGIARALEAMTQMEKPIVARVNGDAAGFGSSLVFACDLIVAREDATIVDTHLGMGEHAVGSPFGIVPGDGGVLTSLYMSPARAKEYLMLAKPYTGAELARLGIINYAVAAGELDTVVNDLVTRLLKRPAHQLAWTKRITNRLTMDHLNRALDASMAYEMVGFLQLEKADWKVRETLD